jgi:FK506-binding protein 4/5
VNLSYDDLTSHLIPGYGSYGVGYYISFPSSQSNILLHDAIPCRNHMFLTSITLCYLCIKKFALDHFPRDVKMGYRRLKEKVKEQKRKETKLYGNMISKLSKLEDSETEGGTTQAPSKKHGLWPLTALLRRLFTRSDGSKESMLWLVLRLLIPVVLLVAVCVAFYMRSGPPEVDCINC